MDYTQAQDAITKIVGVMSVEDKPALIALLKRSGSLVEQSSSQTELLDAAFKAIKNSPRFRQDLNQYLNSVATVEASANGYSNAVGDQWGISTAFNVGTSSATPTATAEATTTAKSGTKVGNLLRSIFTKENISSAVNAGIGILGTKLQSKANATSEQNAIDYQVAAAQAAQAQSAAAAVAPAKKSWVLPVAIIGGVLLIGTIAYFAMRKK